MDEYRNEPRRPATPRRRKKTKAQIFKETYLPLVIAAVAIVLIVVFIVGAIVRNVQKKNALERLEQQSIAAQEEESAKLALEEQTLLVQAAELAATYDYDGAIAVLDTFSGDISKYPTISGRRAEYVLAKSQMVVWDDPGKVVNLSFQMLIADIQMSLRHQTRAQMIINNFITTDEFSRILQELYDNGYILVKPSDFVEASVNAEGETVFTPKTLYLPAGKKPLMITQTNVNYNVYLVDSDGDRKADKYGGGFANKLVLDSSGNITCEMINSTGQTVYGDFDLIPILDAFVEENPDFSYRGAKAIIALTGYNGLFGHRTQPDAVLTWGQEIYDDAVVQAKAVAERLRETGYILACYSYDNVSYGDIISAQIDQDLTKWDNEVVPILGEVDILVYAQGDDIVSGKVYSGEKYQALKNHGFNYFIGFCSGSEGWFYTDTGYARQGRILVTGTNLANHSDWFMGMFYASNVLDSARSGLHENE